MARARPVSSSYHDSNHHVGSWPPTQIRLVGGSAMHGDDAAHDGDIPLLDRDPDLAFIDEDPLTYFLTPAPSLGDQDADGDLDMMDFDAGIEDASHPPHIVRSVSPSSLDGGSTTAATTTAAGGVRSRFASAFRPPTPPRSPPAHMASDPADSTTDDDDEDDDEDYIRLGQNFRLPSPPFSLRDFASLKARKDARHAAAAAATDPLMMLTPPSASFPPGPVAISSLAGRGRVSARFGHSPRRGSSHRRRLSPHSWREPSPDVWSIEEVPEEDARADAVEDAAVASTAAGADSAAVKEAVAVQAKPKKRVRFALP